MKLVFEEGELSCVFKAREKLERTYPVDTEALASALYGSPSHSEVVGIMKMERKRSMEGISY